MATMGAKLGQSGIQMALKAFGIDIDPEMIPQVMGAVKEVAARMMAIEKKLDRVLSLLGEKENGGTGNGETRS
jgi:hypothetical protein